MQITEFSFPTLYRAHEEQLTRELEIRRSALERLEETEGGHPVAVEAPAPRVVRSGRVALPGRRGVPQRIVAWFRGTPAEPAEPADRARAVPCESRASSAR
ncbi:hypothetical protein [Compostimonas suwonensis]|uniref:Uncharacterized protein n=1 Tax=Compostimonas suwonensis TaxID=1048394 RepID=A0A2M9BB34_9MICO|nr:hypothetical protein [Compostimonas suwonensis]PJJ55155.1 hypothetical protein CLV54_3495 [Compostimonas suwonensis]